MKIPESIKINNRIVTIKIVKDLTAERGHFGEYAPKIQEIRLDAELLNDHKLSCFIHEVIEAINAIYCLDMEHRYIQTLGVTLAQGLSPLFKD